MLLRHYATHKLEKQIHFLIIVATTSHPTIQNGTLGEFKHQHCCICCHFWKNSVLCHRESLYLHHVNCNLRKQRKLPLRCTHSHNHYKNQTLHFIRVHNSDFRLYSHLKYFWAQRTNRQVKKQQQQQHHCEKSYKKHMLRGLTSKDACL